MRKKPRLRKRILKIVCWAFIGLMFGIGLWEMLYRFPLRQKSETENRLLADKPTLTLKALLDGSYETGLEDFLIDHFPFREKAIQASNALFDAVSLASFEDYAAVIESNTRDMELSAEADGEDDFVMPTPLPTPKATATPLPALTATATEGEETEASANPLPDVTPEPTSTPRPVKPEADIRSFPELVGIHLKHGGTESVPDKWTAKKVKNQSQVFSAYASALPDDGTLVFTLVPNSTRITQLLSRESPEGMYSDVEDVVYSFTSDKVETVSTANLLSEKVVKGEYVFFTTDMHWTPRGAYYAVEEMMKKTGHTPLSYDAFSIRQEYPFLGTIYRDTQRKQLKDNPDTLDIITPPNEVTVTRFETKTRSSVIPLIDENASARDRYTVYLGGSSGPWTVIENEQASSEDSCLVVCDSYGLCTLPIFATAYRKVHYYDPRYYTKGSLGNISELIQEYSIRDIYVIAGSLHAFDDSFFTTMARHF